MLRESWLVSHCQPHVVAFGLIMLDYLHFLVTWWDVIFDFGPSWASVLKSHGELETEDSKVRTAEIKDYSS